MMKLGSRLLVVIAGLATLAIVATPAGAAGGNKQADLLLVLEHPAGLKKFVRQVSTPTSKHYRRYRSVGYLSKRFGASKRDQHRTLRWLARHGLEGEVGPTGAWIVASARDDSVPKPLAAAAGGGRVTDVPRALRGQVSSIESLGTEPVFWPATASFTPSPGSSILPNTGTQAGCEEGRRAGLDAPYAAYTPNQYLSAYRHAKLHRRGFTGAGQRVALVEIDSFRRDDIETWTECFGIEPPPIDRHRVDIKGSVTNLGESSLDLQVLSAAAPGLDSIGVYAGSGSEKGLFLTAAAALGKPGLRPDVISISLENCEPDLFAAAGFKRGLDHVFMVAAGAGISTLVASGDQGSTMCERPKIGALPLAAVSTPSTSAYVTAVGGTSVALDPANRITNEITWNDGDDNFGASGGGVSLLTPRPWYQRGMGGSNSVGRSRTVPDVAALADALPGYAVYCSASSCNLGNAWLPVGGTSAATPLLAAGTALANERAAKAGQQNLGLLNPLLYRVGTGRRAARLFFDVVEGNNDLGMQIPAAAGGGAPIGCCSAGPGYDLATGFGSPDVASLSRIAVRMARQG